MCYLQLQYASSHVSSTILPAATVLVKLAKLNRFGDIDTTIWYFHIMHEGAPEYATCFNTFNELNWNAAAPAEAPAPQLVTPCLLGPSEHQPARPPASSAARQYSVCPSVADTPRVQHHGPGLPAATMRQH